MPLEYMCCYESMDFVDHINSMDENDVEII